MHMTSSPTLSVPSIGAALSAAWEGMRARLFRPFRIGLWFTLGFAAWLSEIDQSIGSMLNTPLQFINFEEAGADLAGFLDRLPVIWLGMGIAFAMLLLVVAYYISARGRFMLVHQLATGRIEVAAPWRENGAESLSYFLWTLLLGFALLALAAVLLIVPAVALGVFSTADLGTLATTAGVTALVVFAVLLLIAVSFGWFVLTSLILPMMWIGRCRFPEAWRMFWHALRSNPGVMLLFGLVLVALSMVYGLAVFAAGLLTCCCGFFLLAIPYLGQVLMLPVYVFNQLFILEFLKGFGPEYDAFAARTPAMAYPTLDDDAELPEGFA